MERDAHAVHDALDAERLGLGEADEHRHVGLLLGRRQLHAPQPRGQRGPARLVLELAVREDLGVAWLEAAVGRRRDVREHDALPPVRVAEGAPVRRALVAEPHLQPLPAAVVRLRVVQLARGGLVGRGLRDAHEVLLERQLPRGGRERQLDGREGVRVLEVGRGRPAEVEPAQVPLALLAPLRVDRMRGNALNQIHLVSIPLASFRYDDVNYVEIKEWGWRDLNPHSRK